MNSAVAGLIAGIIGGIVAFIFVNIGGVIGVFPPSQVPAVQLATNHIILNAIWGIVFGVIYSKVHDVVPSKGISKGLIYGLIVFIISSFRTATFYMPYAHIDIYAATVAMWAFVGFFALTSYGLVLSVLYKK